jgi:hypothetical protein
MPDQRVFRKQANAMQNLLLNQLHNSQLNNLKTKGLHQRANQKGLSCLSHSKAKAYFSHQAKEKLLGLFAQRLPPTID